MRRPAGIDFLSSALSALLWFSGFLLIVTGFHVTSAKAAGWLPSVADCGIYYLVALMMHLVFARRIASVRGWRFWLMPCLTVPLVALLLFLLHWVPIAWIMLRYGSEGLGLSLDFFGSSLYHRLVMLPDIIFLMYPLLIAHQFLIRVLYRSAAAGRPAQVQA